MPTNMNSHKRTPLLELLLKGLDDINETIINLEGDVKSEDITALKEKIGELQENLTEAEFKISIEQEFSSKLHAEIDGLERKISSLREEEQNILDLVDQVNSKLIELNTQIAEKEYNKKKLDTSIKEKEDKIKEQNISLDNLQNKIEILTNETTEKEELIEKQYSTLEEIAIKIHDLLDEIAEKEDYIEDQNKHIKELDEKIHHLSDLVAIKDDLIIKQDKNLEEVKEKLDEYVEKEKRIMQEISGDEKFIMLTLGENNQKMGYRGLLSACEEKFEGLRLILKKMKEKGIVDYDGILPGFNSEINLLRNL